MIHTGDGWVWSATIFMSTYHYPIPPFAVICLVNVNVGSPGSSLQSESAQTPTGGQNPPQASLSHAVAGTNISTVQGSGEWPTLHTVHSCVIIVGDWCLI